MRNDVVDSPGRARDFFEYNDFLDLADATLDALDLTDDIQVASFHPAYQFADTAQDDVENCTNRSPYPMLHLLRQASVERAVAAVAGYGEDLRSEHRDVAATRRGRVAQALVELGTKEASR